MSSPGLGSVEEGAVHMLDAGQLAMARRRAPWLILTVAMVAQAMALAQLADTLWFVGDDWDPLLRRGTVPEANVGWLAPHNGNPVVLWVLSYRLVFDWVGMRQYLPYAAITIAWHLVGTALVFILVRRITSRPWLALAAAWALLFFGAGKDALMYSATLGHTASAALTLLALLVVQRPPGWHRDLQAAGALLAGTFFSTVGLVGVAFVGGYLATQRQWRSAAVVAAVPGAAYALWATTAGRTQTVSYFPRGSAEWMAVPRVALSSLTEPVGGAVGASLLGLPLLALIVLAVVRWRDGAPALRQLALAGLVAAVLHGLLLGATRPFMDPSTGRYAYVTFICLLPGVLYAFSWAGAAIGAQVGPRVRAVVAMVLFAGYALIGLVTLTSYTTSLQLVTSVMPDRVQSIVAASDAGEVILTPEFDNFINQDLDVRLLVTSQIKAALPPALPVDAATLLDVEAAHMVAVGAESRVAARTDSVHGDDSFVMRPAGTDGCQRADPIVDTPALAFWSARGAEISVDSASTQVTVQLTRDGVTSARRTYQVESERVYISTTAAGVGVFVSFDDGSGPYEICLG